MAGKTCLYGSIRLMKVATAKRRSAKHKVCSEVFLTTPLLLTIACQGGTTYIAIASLYLAPRLGQEPPLTAGERQSTIHWLLQNQDQSGGFCGRTGKDADACYCFWCGAALQVGDVASHCVVWLT